MNAVSIQTPALGGALGWKRLVHLFVQDYLRTMRGRTAWMLWGFIVLSVLSVPTIMNGPQEKLVRVIGALLGGGDLGKKLIMVLWFDSTMNKLSLILGPVLAGGIIVGERERGSYDLLLAKPISVGDYYTVRLASALAAVATFYLGAVLSALATFPTRVNGFDTTDFLAVSVTHVFAALFAASASALIAVTVKRRMPGALVSFVVLGMLISFAFVGFNSPAFRMWSYLNPFFDGVFLISALDHYGAADILGPIAMLIAFNALAWWLGRQRAIALAAEA